MLHPVDGATYGHRYWCIMMLVIYAVKCGIPYEEVKKQAYDLVSELNSRKPDQPFTVDDVNSALECYDVQFATFPIDDISRLSGISIEKNKRNGLKQKQHLYLARRRKEDMKAIDLPMKAPEGRPPQEQTVREWRRLHPNGKKADCIRAVSYTHLDVYKRQQQSFLNKEGLLLLLIYKNTITQTIFYYCLTLDLLKVNVFTFPSLLTKSTYFTSLIETASSSKPKGSTKILFLFFILKSI